MFKRQMIMYYLFQFSEQRNKDFLQKVKGLVGEKESIKEVYFPEVKMSLERAGYSDCVESDMYNLDFPQIFEAILPSDRNYQLKNLMFSKSKDFVLEEKECNPINKFSGDNLNNINYDLLIFNIEDIRNNFQFAKALFLSIKQRPCPILFIHPEANSFSNLVLKYSGKESSIFSIYTFSKILKDKAAEAMSSILISPFTFRKTQLAAEKRFVKKAGSLFGYFGFIKLPFNNVEDFVDYAHKNNSDLIVLPKSDLAEVMKLIKENKLYNKTTSKGISVFVS